MVASVTSFASPFQLTPSPLMTSMDLFSQAGGTIFMRIFWDPRDTGMDTTVVPDLTSFTAIVDGTPRSVDFIAWIGPFEMDFQIFSPPASVDVEVDLVVSDPNLRNTSLLLAKAPQTVLNTL